MPYVLVTYRIKNYKHWRAALDADTAHQRSVGVFLRHVLHDQDDENQITLIAQYSCRNELYNLTKRDNHDKLVKKAGVIRSSIRCHWLDEQ